MANEKISAMPAATLPLAGSELVPVVQEGENRRAPASAFGGIAIARCRVASNGTLIDGVGVDSVERISTGDYVVTFDEVFFETPPFCIASSNQLCVIIEEHGTFATTVADELSVNVDVHDKDGARIDRPFTLIAVQGVAGA